MKRIVGAVLRPSSGQIETADNDDTVCHIDCLPEELLSYVFCLARPEKLIFSPKEGDTLLLVPEHLFNVPYVCRRWRNVVLALPVLAPSLDIWRCSKNHQTREIGARFLTSFENKYVGVVMTSSVYDEILALRSAPLVRTLHIYLDPPSPRIFDDKEFMEAPMPHLESLYIFHRPSLFPLPNGQPWCLSFTSSPHPIFKSTPNLRRLCLERYIEPRTFVMPWHQVQELVLLDPALEVWSETLPLMDLHVLTLLGEPMSSASQGPRITLQRLRILNISHEGVAAMDTIDMLTTPSLQSLRCPLSCERKVSEFLSRSSCPLLVVCLVIGELYEMSFKDIYSGRLDYVLSVLPPSVEELQLELQFFAAQPFRGSSALACKISRMLEPFNGLLPQLHSLSLTMSQNAWSVHHGKFMPRGEFMPTVFGHTSKQEKYILAILRARWGQPGAATPKQVCGKKKKRHVHLKRKKLQDGIGTTPITALTRPSPLRIFRLGVPRKDLSPPAKSALTRFSNDGLEVFLDCEPRSFSIFERVRWDKVFRVNAHMHTDVKDDTQSFFNDLPNFQTLFPKTLDELPDLENVKCRQQRSGVRSEMARFYYSS